MALKYLTVRRPSIMRAKPVFAAVLLLCAAASAAAAAANGKDVVVVGDSLAVREEWAAGRSLLHGGEDHDEDAAAVEQDAEVRHAAAMHLILSCHIVSAASCWSVCFAGEEAGTTVVSVLVARYPQGTCTVPAAPCIPRRLPRLCLLSPLRWHVLAAGYLRELASGLCDAG